MKQVILTGDRPTGRLHVGHYVGSLKERVKLQNSGDYDEVYIMIADAQALTDNAEHPEKVRQNIIQVALDYLACGIDPAKSTIFIQHSCWIVLLPDQPGSRHHRFPCNTCTGWRGSDADDRAVQRNCTQIQYCLR